MTNTLVSIVFYGLAALCVIFAIAAVTVRNIFRAALALTASLSLVAGIFVLLGADFLAAAQILVYVGGIMILMLFVVMLSQQPLDSVQKQTNNQWFWAALFAFCIGGALVFRLKSAYSAVVEGGARVATSASIGQLLLGDMIVPFETVSLVLLAALVGAVLFGSSSQNRSAS